jgi:hypothetical protein
MTSTVYLVTPVDWFAVVLCSILCLFRSRVVTSVRGFLYAKQLSFIFRTILLLTRSSVMTSVFGAHVCPVNNPLSV